MTATDDAGNEATCTFTVTVQDTGKPTITCPDAITVNAPTTGPATTVSWDAPATSDNWGVDSVTSTVASGTSFSIGTLTSITYTVTDKADLTATCSFTVTVLDTTDPVLTCPSLHEEDIRVAAAHVVERRQIYPHHHVLRQVEVFSRKHQVILQATTSVSELSRQQHIRPNKLQGNLLEPQQSDKMQACWRPTLISDS